jgi:ADP-ribose pyrophosphatase
LKPEEDDPALWEILERVTHADCRVFTIERKRCRHPVRQSENDFFSVHSPHWVNVLALTPDGQLVLVNQFRFGVEGLSLEIPGGLIDPGEEPLAAGLRELQEETGYVGRNARIIGTVWPNPAIMDNICSFVLVEDCELSSGSSWDHHEEIGVSLAPVDQVMEWARSGRIRHSLVLNALFYLEPIWKARVENGQNLH